MKYSLLFLLILFISCNQQKNGNVFETIEIDLDDKELICSESAAFDSCSIVQLEVTENSLLGDIAKVVCIKDRIYILSMMDPTLFIFDKSGKFISKLNTGKGPGEIIFVSDIVVHNDTLLVLDNYRVIKAYDLDGNYIEEKMKLDSPYFSMYFTDNGTYLMEPNINSRSEYNLHVIKDNCENFYLPKNKWLKNISLTTYSSMRDGYVVWPLTDKIYRIDEINDTVECVYWIDFKGKWISEQDFNESVNTSSMCDGDLNKYARWLKDVSVLSNQGLFFSFKYDKDYFVKYCNGEVKLYSHLLSDFPEMTSSSVGSYNNNLIYVYSPEKLKEYRDKHPQSKLNQLKFLNKESEDLNPVLCFIPK